VGCAILMASFYSVSRLYTFYSRFMLDAAAQQLVAACHYLAHTARCRSCRTSLKVDPSGGYVVDDGSTKVSATFDGNVQWGVSGVVLGPPSKPTSPVLEPLVGGVSSPEGSFVQWDESGAACPAALYLHAQNGSCAAITIPRSADGTIKCYYLVGEKWVLRN